jgi:hypothetical protein
MYKIGDLVKVSSENDNDNYDDFREKVLRIVHVATNTSQHMGYDESMQRMGLYDLETLDGKEINYSLYEYELEDAE